MREYRRDYQNLVGGMLLVAFGASLSVYSATHYKLGEVSRMGPGMYPASIGALLVFLGLLVFVTGFKKSGTFPSLDIRPLACCFGGIAAFVVLIVPFGLIPAVCALTLISILSDAKLSVFGAIALAVALSAISVFVFKIGLAVPMNLLKWPF